LFIFCKGVPTEAGLFLGVDIVQVNALLVDLFHFHIPLEQLLIIHLFHLDPQVIYSRRYVVNALNGKTVEHQQNPVNPSCDLVSECVFDLCVKQNLNQEKYQVVTPNAQQSQYELQHADLVRHVPDPDVHCYHHHVENEHPRPATVSNQTV
jgi:hypothetical protein